jgi:hypothetical protein
MNTSTFSLAEASELLEVSPLIKQLQVVTWVADQQVSIEIIDFNSRHTIWECSDNVLNADGWTRFGRAVRNSALSSLCPFRSMSSEDGELGAAAARCIDAFLAEAKHNESITLAAFNLWSLSMDDVSGFILNNKALQGLALDSWEPVPLVQSTALSRAICSAQLARLYIDGCVFENNGSFERMLEGCSRLRALVVSCRYNWQCTAVATLLRDLELS